MLAGSPELALDLGSSSTWVPSDQAVVFVDNHDTERNGSTLSYADAERYALANVLMLAGHATARPRSTPATRSPTATPDRRRTPTAACSTPPARDAPGPGAEPADGDWVCQHRWPAIAGMVGWRSVVGDAPRVDVWSEGAAVAFGRGERGFVVVNAGDDELRDRAADEPARRRLLRRAVDATTARRRPSGTARSP